MTVEELLKTVCAEFRIPYRHEGPGVPTVKDYVDALNEFLLRLAECHDAIRPLCAIARKPGEDAAHAAGRICAVARHESCHP